MEGCLDLRVAYKLQFRLMKHEIMVEVYETPRGGCPYLKWQSKLPILVRGQVRSKLNQIRLGNFSDSKSIKKGVKEIRIHSGPGYRVYFGIAGGGVVLLLCGGNKSSQARDIDLAVACWEEYKARLRAEGGMQNG